MPTLEQLSANVPPLAPHCPTCGKAMKLKSVTPTAKGVVYGYVCKEEHAFEFAIND
jgi:hypothetical protein